MTKIFRLFVFLSLIALPTLGNALQVRLGQSFRVTDAKAFGSPYMEGALVELIDAKLVDGDDDQIRTVQLTFRLELTAEKRKEFGIDRSAMEPYSLVVKDIKSMSEIPGLLPILHFRSVGNNPVEKWLMNLINE
jgi:hypothetical protein